MARLFLKTVTSPTLDKSTISGHSTKISQ